jgi:CRP-like cAMP-binding protein
MQRRRGADIVFTGLPSAFLELPREYGELLADNTQVRNLANKECLAERGRPNPPIFLVRTGLLAVSPSADVENKPIVTDFVGPNNSLFVAATSSTDVSPYEIHSIGSSTVLTWDIQVFRTVKNNCPKFSEWVFEHLVSGSAQHYLGRARAATQQLEAQLAYFYWTLSEPIPDSDNRLLTAKIPQNYLGSYFGVPREEISRKKKLLEKTGYIETVDAGILLSSHVHALFALQEAGPAPWESPWLQA